MRRFGVRVLLVILLGTFTGALFGQKMAGKQDFTADELAVNASSLYAQGKYSEAAALYQRFLADFGSGGIAFERVGPYEPFYSVTRMNKGSAVI